MIRNSKLEIRNSQRAFALLFAMFVASIMLSIGLGISNVIYKELILSSIGRESEFSLYTAQTGLECALYIEGKHPALFPRQSGDLPIPALLEDDKCAGQKINTMGDLQAEALATGATTTFNIMISYTGANVNNYPPMCAKVSVYKSASNYMRVESRGYNTCDTTNSRRVERSLKLRTNITH